MKKNSDINNKFVSIIVPVYNTPEPLLRSCFESVKKQTSPNWELIVVDDGSSDENAKIIDNLCSDIPNTRVIHKENGGVSSARNEAIKYASGEWITFVDSDCTLPKDAIKIYADSVNLPGNENSDMIIGFCTKGTRVIKDGLDVITLEYNSQNNENDANKIEIIKDKNELVNHLLTYRVKRWSNRLGFFSDGPWGKLVKTEFVKDTLFPNNLQWDEDTVWLLDFVSKSEKILLIPQIVYNSVHYIGSATRQYRANCLQEFYDICTAEKEREKLFPNCKDAIAFKRFSNVLLLSRLYFFHQDNPKTRKQIYKEFVVWCKRKETKAVFTDVLLHLHNKRKRTLIALAMKMRCYHLCWNFFMKYSIKRGL